MKSHIANNIHAFRSNKGLSQAQLAEIADVTQGAISSWETGITIPRKSNLQPIVNAFEELTIDDFLSDKEGYAQKILRRSQPRHAAYTTAPFYGSIAAGTPLEMIPVDDQCPIPVSVLRNHPHGFFLRVKGESMNRCLPHGAYALIDPDEPVVDTKIYAVSIDGREATIKRLRLIPRGIELVPDSYDDSFRPLRFLEEEKDPSSIAIIGRVVWYCLPPGFEL